MAELRIVADLCEVPSRIPAMLEELGADVEIRPLAAGDYVLELGWVVERKTVRDLHGSVLAGRFWTQIGKLRREARRPCLLIEGPDLDAGELSPNAVRGVCVTVLDVGVAILPSRDAADSARWLSGSGPSAESRPAAHPPSRRSPRAVPASPARARLGRGT